MHVMRVTKRTHADLSGEGAKLYGGRWNSPGRAVVYAASCGALAALEYRVHVKTPPTNLLLIRIEVPDTLPLEEMPSIPADPNVLFQLGNEWLADNKTPLLRVPSVLVPRQWNLLINPSHPLSAAIRPLRLCKGAGKDCFPKLTSIGCRARLRWPARLRATSRRSWRRFGCRPS